MDLFIFFNPSLFLIPAVYLSLALYIIISFYCLISLHLCVSSTSSFCPLTPSFHFMFPFFSSLSGLPHDSRTLIRPTVYLSVSPAAARSWISASSAPRPTEKWLPPPSKQAWLCRNVHCVAALMHRASSWYSVILDPVIFSEKALYGSFPVGSG